MKQIPLTRGFFALVDDEDFEELSKYKWSTEISGKTFYAKRKERGKTVKMHRQILGLTDKSVITDHENRNGLDNQRHNIRACNFNENQRNKGIYKNNSSGFKGVSFCLKTKKYKSQIRVGGHLVYLGYFKDAITAAKAYNEAAKKYHGEFANLNEI